MMKVLKHLALGIVVLFALILSVDVALNIKENTALKSNHAKFLDIKEEIIFESIKSFPDEVIVGTDLNNLALRTNTTLDSLYNNPRYLRLFVEDWELIKNFNGSLYVSPLGDCGEKDCTLGTYVSPSNDIIIYSFNKRVVTSQANKSYVEYLQHLDGTYELIHTYLHEVGHLIYSNFVTSQERYEWEILHNQSTDELRDYTKGNPKEDFADAYAFYRLGEDFDKNKERFVKEQYLEAKNAVK